MLNKFRIGDKVIIKREYHNTHFHWAGEDMSARIGMKAIISSVNKIRGGYSYQLKLPASQYSIPWYWHEKSLELISSDKVPIKQYGIVKFWEKLKC